MGLGLLGRGLGDAIFLAECGAELTITDLRDEKTLAPSLKKLKKYKNIRYTLGGHKMEDFRNRDFILKAAGVPLDSPFITEARKRGIAIEMDASLFAKLMPNEVTIVGVTGTRGKSTTTALIYEILSSAKRLTLYAKRSVFKGGNLVPEATLPLLAKIRAGDIVVLELDSWQLQGFHDAKISPHVAVFTTFLDDHLVYYHGDRKRYFEDKTAIFRYQKRGDVLVVGKQVLSTRSDLVVEKGRTFLTADALDVPADWRPKILGEHNLENIACALAVARSLAVPDAVSRRVIERFKGISGRLEHLRAVCGVKIYNDTNATTPDATLAALRALSTKSEIRNPNSLNAVCDYSTKRSTLDAGGKRIVLIMGGTDKGLDMSKLVAEIPKHCKAVVLLKESGTEKLLSEFPGLTSPLIKGVPESARAGVVIKDTLDECLMEAMKIAKRGDIVLFSPAFASFGRWFKNEYDRGEQFVEFVKRLKA